MSAIEKAIFFVRRKGFAKDADNAESELSLLLAIKDAAEFHPRAMKLMQKKKNFVVVAEDEPYFMDVYKMIRKHEKEIGRWTEADEDKFQAADGWDW